MFKILIAFYIALKLLEAIKKTYIIQKLRNYMGNCKSCTYRTYLSNQFSPYIIGSSSINGYSNFITFIRFCSTYTEVSIQNQLYLTITQFSTNSKNPSLTLIFC